MRQDVAWHHQTGDAGTAVNLQPVSRDDNRGTNRRPESKPSV